MSERGRERVILTPEHVQVKLRPAGLGSRFLALIADALIIAAVAFGIRLILYLVPGGIGPALAATLVFVLQWGYHVFFEVYRQGRSPGKRLAGLRVVDGRGLPITVEQSMVRNVVRVLDFAPAFYGLGALVCLFDRDRRRLGDIAADTLVVRETQPLPARSSVASSRHFNSLRTAAMLRRIRHRITLEEKEFLLALCLRAEQLEDQVRYDLMEEVAAAYRHKLEIDDPHLSGESLVRDLTAILFSDEGRTLARERAPRPTPAAPPPLLPAPQPPPELPESP